MCSIGPSLDPLQTLFTSHQAYDSTSSDYHNHSSTVDYGLTLLESTISPSKGILIELLLTMLLVTIFVHTTMERSEFRPAAPVVIGLALTAAVVSRGVREGGRVGGDM